MTSFLYNLAYLSSTEAPASSSLAFISSASSLATPSLIAFGAASVKSFASFKPRPVISRTALTTLILDAPASVNITSNSVCLQLLLRHQLLHLLPLQELLL